MHSVPHHSLDVAASAFVLLTAFRAPIDVPDATLAFLVALHDIGKFTRPFQAKVRELWPPSLGPYEKRPGFHDDDGYALLCSKLAGHLNHLFLEWRLPSMRQPLFRAVTGHHGRPPRPTDRPVPQTTACDVCIGAAGAFIDETFAVLAPPVLPKLGRGALDRLAWFLAGLAVAADWLGSGQHWFQPVDAAEHTDLQRYWHEIALPRARQAAGGAGLLPAPVSPIVGLTGIFPGIEARPVQSWAEQVPLPDGPALFTIEDMTGSGKTEAALVLAHRLMASGRGDGLFYALPTMATADAMYGRLAGAYRRLFAENGKPSLVLAHGRRAYHKGFRDSILDDDDRTHEDVREPADQTAGAQCAAWIADDRRKAFLAEVGVGTLDQAIMAVLPTRHAPLRLFGLSRRVLIVDEAHAYDAYMTEELRALLNFQAALGGSAIVLSATLTAKQRAGLNAAFLSGLGHQAEPDDATAYPLVTVASASAISAEACKPAPGLGRRVAVTRIADPDAAVAAIIEAARAGAAVAWVRNAVDDAIEAEAALRAAGLDPLLFHARFAMGDRQNIEGEVANRFGRHSSAEMRRGCVLVGTQVVEQSLDLDFDLMVSDLAPVDLVIQRAGRLWRHLQRERPIAGPRLVLLAPDPVDDPPADWLGAALRRTGFVYPDHALLWRSARILMQTGVIETPDGIRRLVEHAYDDEVSDAIPPGLARTALSAMGGTLAATAAGHLAVLKIDDPYDRAAGQWDPDIRTPTRLGEARIVFRLARAEDGRAAPYFPHDEPHRAWALSEVSVRQNRLESAPEEAAVAAAKKAWPVWDREIPVLLLRPGLSGGWTGQGTDPKGRICTVTYDARRGLMIGT